MAPPFELKDLSGNSVRLSDYKGHPVLLDFWATWCAPCRMSIPMVEQFYESHKKDGLIVLGMNMDDESSSVFPFVKHFGMKYPVLLAGNSSVAGDYGIDGIPLFAFIDAEGRLDQRYDGFSPEMPQEWEAELERLLAKR
jgi:thiol-disulfide isomerase/thioredoxin